MSTFTVQHTCGHESKHAYTGPEGALQQRKEWLQGRPCQACWRAQESTLAADQSQELNLPELEGSEQDKPWAAVIRLKVVEHNRDYVKKLVGSKKVAAEEETMRTAIITSANEALRELESQRDAGWWIANRFDALTFVKAKVVKAVTPILDARSE